MFLMLLALIVFGPRRLPEIGRQIGKLMYEFRKVSNDFKFQMEEELRASEEAARKEKAAAAAKLNPPAIQAQAVMEYAPPVAQIAAQSGAAGGAAGEIGNCQPAVVETRAVETQAIETQAVEGELPAVAGEVRGEPRKFPPAMPPTILPPSSGDQVLAQRPFRGSLVPVGAAQEESVAEKNGNGSPESNAEANFTPHIVERPSVESEQEARHA
jgi:sec-independent protein translocase protein TatB